MVVLFVFGFFVSFSADTSGSVSLLHELDPTSNFFTQVEDTRQIEIVDKRDSLLLEGYQKAIENECLIVYFKKKTCGIAVYDKSNGYTWYSTYDNMESEVLTAAVKTKIESGVTIEYYVVDTKGEIQSKELTFGTRVKNKLVGSNTMKIIDPKKNFEIDVSFILNETKSSRFVVSFKVDVSIDKDKLLVNVPYESIVEEEIKIGEASTSLNQVPNDYRLKSITLFPYFGSENYKINGYSFIPDGSGALIRYNQHESSTAYIKKLYGSDYSFTDYTNSSYIKDNGYLNLPIFGINHGYNQASFLCEATNGLGSIELHSYPYKYSLIPVNTTFFKYYVRDTFTVNMSQGTMYLLNEAPYPSDYSLTYSFLSGEKANYVGMAECYRESLGLDDSGGGSDIPLRLEILGIDYKPGLFGRNYVTMTTYLDALEIIKDLENSGVNNFNVTYLGWNRGGYFNKGATTARTSLLLGGKNKLLEFSNYLKENGYMIDYTINPYVTSNYGFGSKTVKKIGLSPFEVTQKSSLDQVGYYVLPTELAKIINNKDKRYQNLGIDGLNINDINVAYSYRYNSVATYRTQMIEQVVNEISKLSGYSLSTERPNSYLLKYMTNYYDAYYESNKFIYETDSIPFLTLLLSGSVSQYIPNINYISDYELAVLRMIEYNIYPSFIVTKEEAYKLRYTNYEYLNSTEYSLWKDLMVKMYDETNNALRNVIGAKMISHVYLLDGVCKCGYSNGVVIYVNYNNKTVDCDGFSLSPYSYLVKGGN